MDELPTTPTDAPRRGVLTFSTRERPLSVSLARYGTQTLFVLLRLPLLALLWDLAATGVMVWVATRGIRDGDWWLAQLLVLLVGMAVVNLLGWLHLKRMAQRNWWNTLLFGRLRFAPLKWGPRRMLLNLVSRCIQTLRLQFHPSDEELIRAMGKAEVIAARVGFGEAFTEFRRSQIPTDQVIDSVEHARDQTWEDIKVTETYGLSFNDALLTGTYSIYALKAFALTGLTGTLGLIFAGSYVWVLGGVAGGGAVVTLVQFSMIAGFAIGFIVFINFTLSLRSIVVIPNLPGFELTENMKEAIDQEAAGVRASIDARAGAEMNPRLRITDGYVDAVRLYFVRFLGCYAAWNLFVFATLVLIQWPIARAFSSWSAAEVDDWTRQLLVGAVFAPVALAGSLWLGLVVFSRFRQFVGLVVTGVAMIVIPVIFNYLFGGANDSVVLWSSLIAAVITVLPGAIAEVVKSKPNALPAALAEGAPVGRGAPSL